MEKDDGCRAYEKRTFTEERAGRIARIRGVVEEYGREGMNITVRQCYYQFVARGWAPSGDRTYSQVQSDLNAGRMAGLVPWYLVEDRGRTLRGIRSWTSPQAGVRELREQYRLDLWADQDWRPEVWVEKRALEGVVGDVCSADDLRVDYYATGGYDSQSQQWRAGQRMADYVRRGQRPIVFYLGDHDPSGLDMTRDVRDRLSLFAGVPVIVQRLALNMDQIERYSPPPFDVKMGDARSGDYVLEHGRTAWELDALEPRVLKTLIRDAVLMIKNQDQWNSSLAEEVEDLRTLDEYLEATQPGSLPDPGP